MPELTPPCAARRQIRHGRRRCGGLDHQSRGAAFAEPIAEAAPLRGGSPVKPGETVVVVGSGAVPRARGSPRSAIQKPPPIS